MSEEATAGMHPGAGSDHARHEGHGQSHAHAHGPKNFNRAFAIGVVLNAGFVVTEVLYGLSAHSLALISDAGHNLSDVLGLVLAWVAIRLATARPTARRTYGYRRASIFAALANAVMLMFVTGAVTWEAILRLRHPQPVMAMTIVSVAVVGIVINGVTAMLFYSGRAHDVNIRGAFMHMAADALVALGVVIAGLAIRWTGLLWIDPVVSIAIGVVITIGTWSLLRESTGLAMDSVPEHIDPLDVEGFIAGVPGVTSFHDLHIWAMSTTETALTVHLVTPNAGLDDARLAQTATALRDRFRIGHCTIQLERGDNAHPCAQAGDATV